MLPELSIGASGDSHFPPAVTVAVAVVVVGAGLWTALMCLRNFRFDMRRRRTHELQLRQAGTMAQRTYRNFLSAVATQPGLGLKLASCAALASALAVTKGIAFCGAVLVGSVVLYATVGFLWWRRWGP